MRTRVLLVALLAAGCGSFPNPSDDYACERDRDCPDGRVCRSGWCVVGGGGCDQQSCDDFEDCTIDSCQAGQCVHESMEDGTPCGGEGTCVAAATCHSGTCQGEPAAEGAPCDDGFFCTEADACDGSGGCVGVDRHCESSDACSTGQCNEEIDACEQVAVDDYSTCSDGDLCTRNDVCVAGSCGGGAACGCDSSCGTCDGGCCEVDYVGTDCGGEGCPTDCAVQGCSCYYGCAGSLCGGECQADCSVLCSAGARCDLTCSADSLCDLDCTGADQCRLDCTDNAHCLVTCGGDGCNRGACPDGWTECGGGVYACNRPCP